MAKKTTIKSSEQNLDQTIDASIKGVSNQAQLATKAAKAGLVKSKTAKQVEKDLTKQEEEKLQKELDQVNAKLKEDVQSDLFVKAEGESAGNVVVAEAGIKEGATATDAAGGSVAGISAAGVNWAMVGLGALGVAGVAAAASSGGGGGGVAPAPVVQRDEILTFDVEGERNFTLNKNTPADPEDLTPTSSSSDTVFIGSEATSFTSFDFDGDDETELDLKVMGNLEVTAGEDANISFEHNVAGSSFIVDGSTTIKSTLSNSGTSAEFYAAYNSGSTIQMGGLSIEAGKDLDVFDDGSYAVNPELTRLSDIENSEIDAADVYVGIDEDGDLVTLETLQAYLSGVPNDPNIVRTAQALLDYATFVDLNDGAVTSLDSNLVLVPVYGYETATPEAPTTVLYYVLAPIDGLSIHPDIYSELAAVSVDNTLVFADEYTSTDLINDLDNALFSYYAVEVNMDADFTLTENYDTDVTIAGLSMAAATDVNITIDHNGRIEPGNTMAIDTGDVAAVAGDDASMYVGDNYVSGREAVLNINGSTVNLQAKDEADFEIWYNYTDNRDSALNISYQDVTLNADDANFSVYDNYTNEVNSDMSITIGNVAVSGESNANFELDYNGTYYDSNQNSVDQYSTFVASVQGVTVTSGEDAYFSINENYAEIENSLVDIEVGNIAVTAGGEDYISIDDNSTEYENSHISIKTGDIALTTTGEAYSGDAVLSIDGNYTDEYNSSIKIETGNIDINVAVDAEDAYVYIKDNDVYYDKSKLDIVTGNINIGALEDDGAGIEIYDNDLDSSSGEDGEKSELNVTVGDVAVNVADDIYFDIDYNDGYDSDNHVVINVGEVNLTSHSKSTIDDVSLSVEENYYSTINFNSVNANTITLKTNAVDAEVYFDVIGNDDSSLNFGNVLLDAGDDVNFNINENDDSTITFGNVVMNAVDDVRVNVGNISSNSDSTITIDTLEINAQDEASVNIHSYGTDSINKLDVNATDLAYININAYDTNILNIDDVHAAVDLVGGHIEIDITGQDYIGEDGIGEFELGKMTLTANTADIDFAVDTAIMGINNEDDIYLDITGVRGVSIVNTVFAESGIYTYDSVDGEPDNVWDGFDDNDSDLIADDAEWEPTYYSTFADIEGMTIEIGSGNLGYNLALDDQYYYEDADGPTRYADHDNDVETPMVLKYTGAPDTAYSYTTNDWQETFYFNDLLSGEIIIGGFSANENNVNYPEDIIVFDLASGVTSENLIFEIEGDDLIIGFTDTGREAPNGEIRLLDFATWGYDLASTTEALTLLGDQIYFGNLDVAESYSSLIA